MVAIKSHEADRFLKRDCTGFQLYLVFGTDAGLVSERVRALARALVDDPADPFQLVRLAGDEVAGDPGRLADEANTVPLFGGRRAILIEAGARSLLPALEHHLASPHAAPAVVEAGGLKKDAALRKLAERARNGVSIECYPDEAADLGRLIEAEAAAVGLAVDDDARRVLVGLLGADRLASRSEIAKLLLHAHGATAVTLDHVEAVVADASALAGDALIDAAFAGDLAAVERLGRRVLGPGGTDPGVLLGAALRHAVWLHRARLDVEAGTAVEAAVARGGIHFKRKPAVERQLKGSRAEALGRVVVRLGEAVGQVRREPALALPIAMRALWVVARGVGGRAPA